MIGMRYIPKCSAFICVSNIEVPFNTLPQSYFFLKKHHKNPSANCIPQPCSFLVEHLNIQVCVLIKHLHYLAALCKADNFNDTQLKTKEKLFILW